MFSIKLAYCGDFCNLCPRYIATLSGSNEKLKEVAILWKKVGWPYDLDAPEKINHFKSICYSFVRDIY